MKGISASRARAFALALALGAGACSRGPAHPDVILIVCDTLRADAIIDPAGHYDTPNIDGLARDGVLFTQVFAHAPMTLPSHTALFSSRPPGETTVWNNGQKVPKDLPLLAEWMHGHGYRTHAVISLATLNTNPDKGLARGFEDYDVHFWRLAPAEDVDKRAIPMLDKASKSEPLFFFAHYQDPHEPYDSHGVEHREAEVLLDGQTLATVTTSDQSVWSQKIELGPGRHEFIVRSKDQFRLRWFEVKEDDKPLDVKWELGKRLDAVRRERLSIERQGDEKTCEVKLWINDVPNDRERNARYAREVNYADGYIGKFLDELRKTGRYDDSLVIFVSDHGEALGERGHWGHAREVNDPQIHVPLIVKLPKGDPRQVELATRAGRLTQLMDLAPTILEFAGLPPLPGAEGRSLFSAHDTVLVTETHAPESPHDEIALRDEQYKMVLMPEDGSFQLFDLAKDPGEEHDVFATEKGARPDWPARLEALAKRGQERKQGKGAEGAHQDLRDLGYGGDEDDAGKGAGPKKTDAHPDAAKPAEEKKPE